MSMASACFVRPCAKATVERKRTSNKYARILCKTQERAHSKADGAQERTRNAQIRRQGCIHKSDLTTPPANPAQNLAWGWR
eukprot:137810-Rhodomonas_salina.1